MAQSITETSTQHKSSSSMSKLSDTLPSRHNLHASLAEALCFKLLFLLRYMWVDSNGVCRAVRLPRASTERHAVVQLGCLHCFSNARWHTWHVLQTVCSLRLSLYPLLYSEKYQYLAMSFTEHCLNPPVPDPSRGSRGLHLNGCKKTFFKIHNRPVSLLLWRKLK